MSSTAGKVGRGIGKTIKWIVILGALLIIIVIVAVVIGLGSAANDSDDSSKEVSPAEYAAIKDGATLASVKARIGAEPESEDEVVVGNSTLKCIYYGILSSEGTYQFCFDNGRLSSKSRT